MSRGPTILLVATAALLVGAGSARRGSDGGVKLVLLDPTAHPAPSDRCDSPACSQLLDLLDHAHDKIDFALYGLRGQPAVLEALVRAKRRGVAIRGIVDMDASNHTYYSDTEALMAKIGTIKSDQLHDAAKAAEQDDEPERVQVDRCERPAGFLGPLQCVGYDLGDECLVAGLASRGAITYDGDIQHDKFFVVDGRYVWTGSANVSDSDITGFNANVVIVLDSPEIAAQYMREIDQMYGQGRFHRDKETFPEQRVAVGDAAVTVWFPPEGDGEIKALRAALQAATDHIDVSVFYLTHTALAGDLIAAKRRGVRVRVIVDATSALNDYSKHELLRAAGIPVKVENWPGKMHAKAVAIDDRVVFAGSMNWTSAGVRDNDENILEIESPEQARAYEAWFDRLWTSIPDKWSTDRPDPESADSPGSCIDGIDNDFDGTADIDDPGCGPSRPPLADLPPVRVVPKADGSGLIKGNVTAEGKKTYHLPTGAYYAATRLVAEQGDLWFCSEDDARAAGFRRSR